MKALNTIIVIAALLIGATNVTLAGPAKTTTSNTADADWDTGGDWDNGAPDESKDVIIINTSAQSSSGLTFGSGVDLTVKAGQTLTINGNSQFNNGSVVTIEPTGTLVVNGTLHNANNSNTITVDGTLTVNGAFTGGNGSTVEGDGALSATSISTTGTGTVFTSNEDCTGGCNATEGGGVLPVELIEFSATIENGWIGIHWVTGSELNNDYFVVHGSYDGVQFFEMGTIQGMGTTSERQDYEFHDYDPSLEYIQLTQHDFDGASEVIGMTTLAGQQASKRGIGQTSNGRTVFFPAVPTQNPVQVSAVSTTGIVVFQRNLTTAEQSSGQLNLNIEQIAAGLYVLTIEQEGMSDSSVITVK